MDKLIKLNEENINIVNKINEYKSPKNIYIPIITNTTFKLNDYVYKNTFYNEYSSSISGYIKDIKKIKLNNKEVSSIIIENDYKENIKKRKGVKKPVNKEELIKLLEDNKLYNIVSILNKETIIKNIVISSIDEEVYNLKEYITLVNYYNEIIDTLDYLNNLLDSNKSIIATKNTDFKSIKNIKSIIGTYPNIEVVLVPDKYLISYKLFLCSYLNIIDSETLILNASDLYNIYRCLNNKLILDTIISICGTGIKKSYVINTRLYVSLKELLDEYIKFTTDDYEIYLNGYISGKKIDNIDDIIITKDIKSIVINKKDNSKEEACINCGACMKVCPKNINVKRCFMNNIANKNCINCGLCNYICPSNIKLKEIVGCHNEKI